MVRKKGQALVEFVLILPIIILLLLGFIDLGRVVLSKYQLEENLDEVVELYRNNGVEEVDTFIAKSDEELNYSIITDDGFEEITLTKNLDIITPGLNLILKSPYSVSVSRVIRSE